MLGTTTPLEISEAILKFCADIDPTQTAVFIKPEPDPKAILSECFTNVREHIKAHGGSIQLGWIIWETPDIMLEAMFHAIWRSPEGKLVDVTPQMDGEPQILFLPDSNATLKREEGDIVAMRRKPLVDDLLVHEFIRLGDLKDALKVKTNGMLTRKDLLQMFEIEKEQIPLQQQLALKYRGKVGQVRMAPLSFKQPGVVPVAFKQPEIVEGINRKLARVGRNDPCPCGSGKKFKKCCGR